MLVPVKTKTQWISLLFCCVLLAVTAPAMGAGAPGDLQFEREGSEAAASPFPPAFFPHWLHRIRYRCDACHDSLFEMKAGATPVSMALIAEGEACGACHNGNQAFDDSFDNCARCHRQPPD
jgi:c(7)-type cytochrome triheme protein